MKINGYEIKPGADLRNANLSNSDLQYINIQGSNLENAILRNCNMQGVNLKHAKLKGCDLSGSNLDGADLNFADLEEANLSGCSLLRTKLWDAKINKTKFDQDKDSNSDLESLKKKISDLEIENESLKKYKKFYDEFKGKFDIL